MTQDLARRHRGAHHDRHDAASTTPGKSTLVDHEHASNPASGPSRGHQGSLFDGKNPWNKAPAPTDPMFTVETKHLEFPSTYVGDSSTKAVVVRNDDSRPLVLDAVAPLQFDPFHEFAAARPSTLTFQPGEVREVPIAFRPARAVRSIQRFELVSGMTTAGPDAEFTTSGKGIDDRRPAHDAEGTEIRIEAQNHDRVAAEKENDPLRHQRAAAAQAVRDWQQRALTNNQAIAEWTLLNWQDFLGKTGGDYSVFAVDKLLELWKKGVSKGVKKGVKAGSEAMLEAVKESAKIAMFIENPIFAFAIDLGIEKLSEFVTKKLGLEAKSDKAIEKEESDQRALDATKSVGAAGVQKSNEIFAYQHRADLVIRDTASGAELQIAKAEDRNEVKMWLEWAKLEAANIPAPVRANDRSFSAQLLAQWVLEHAGTTKQANKDTNPKAWEAARGELEKQGTPVDLQRTDLFVHQCRHEWGVLGLVEAEQRVAVLDIERKRLEADALRQGLKGPDVAAQVASHQPLVTFHRTVNPEQAAAAFESWAAVFKAPLPTIFRNSFILDCQVWLAVDGAGVRIHHFEYTLSAGSESVSRMDRGRQ